MIKLKYGNTNTFFIDGLLVDTGWAGTMPAFRKALKENGLTLRDVKYVLATHYHPDHTGLIGELNAQGVKLLLLSVQTDSVHFPDGIFKKEGLPFAAPDVSQAVLISCEESRAFLRGLEIDGEILHTPSHSPDSISLVLDNGDCFVGDLEPREYLAAYDDAPALKNDWERILALHPRRIFYGHAPERSV